MDPAVVKSLVDDLLQGGYMGNRETNERHTAAMIYNRQMALEQKNEAQYRMYMVLRKLKSATTYMFPSKELLTRLYPSVKQYPVLNPVLRLYQLIAFPIRKLRSGIMQQEIRTEQTVAEEGAEKRIKLFKQLGLM